MMKFCPKCGKTIKTGSFCNDCNPETIDYKPISVKLCPSKRVFIQGKWSTFKDLREVSSRIVKKFIKQEVELEKGLEGNEELLEKPGVQKSLEITVKYAGKLFKIPINIDVTYSPTVAKVGSTYFEGILQLRNAREEVKNYIRDYVNKNKIFINKVVDKDKEVDYFFVKKHQLQPLALKLMRNFGAKTESNAQLFSRNRMTSRDIFRLNVLVTLPDFAVGDVVEVEDAPFFVKETSKIITGINMITGKKATFRSEEAAEIKKIKKQKSKIMMTHPEIKAMDPETYQLIPLKNPFNLTCAQDQNVVIVKYKGVSYLIR